MNQLCAADSQVSWEVAAAATSPKATCGASQWNNLNFLLPPLYSIPVPLNMVCLYFKCAQLSLRLLWSSLAKGHVALFNTTAKKTNRIYIYIFVSCLLMQPWETNPNPFTIFFFHEDLLCCDKRALMPQWVTSNHTPSQVFVPSLSASSTRRSMLTWRGLKRRGKLKAVRKGTVLETERKYRLVDETHLCILGECCSTARWTDMWTLKHRAGHIRYCRQSAHGRWGWTGSLGLGQRSGCLGGRMWWLKKRKTIKVTI